MTLKKGKRMIKCRLVRSFFSSTDRTVHAQQKLEQRERETHANSAREIQKNIYIERKYTGDILVPSSYCRCLVYISKDKEKKIDH